GGGGGVEEKRKRDPQDLGKVLQAAGADAVGPLLIFLDLLKSDPEGVSELGLAHIEHEPSHPHAAADMLVGGTESGPGHVSSLPFRRGHCRAGAMVDRPAKLIIAMD